MSYDRQLDQVCPHLVTEELLSINGDQKTVRPMYPIAAFDSVVVRLNGKIDCPTEGVYSPAETFGRREGPFTVRKGVNDTLILQVGKTPPQVITIPEALRVSAEKLADLVNPLLKGAMLSPTAKNSLTFKTNLTGPQATAIFLPGSTFAPVLGMVVGRQWAGRQVVPGWTLISDPLTLRDRPTRLIVFDEPLKGLNPQVEVNYTTVRQDCRRCDGLGIEHDWRYNRNGDVVEARDEALLIQEIQKMVWTVRGTNPFHPWYGTSIIEQIGAKITTNGLVQNIIVSDLQTAFRRWQGIKKQQEENAGQPVSDAEFPYRLLGVDVQQSRKDPTVVFVSMSIQNRTLGKPIDLERGIRLPQPLDVLGSTAAQGVFRESLRGYKLTG